MLPEIKKLPVHWTDGMKISEVHFNQLQLAFDDALRDVTAQVVTDFNYGLLPPAPGSRTSLEMVMNPDQSKLIQLKVLTCRAVTPGGARIEINKNNEQLQNVFPDGSEVQLKKDEITEKFYDIVISVNPVKRVPYGQPDPEESPARFPYTQPEYKLELIPSQEMNSQAPGAFHLILGKIEISGGEVSMVEHFIPPCTSIKSSKRLIDEYNKLGNALGEIGSFATQIVQKVKSEKQKTDLASNISFLAEKIVFFLAEKITGYRWRVAQQPPVFLVETFVSFAYLFKSAVDCQTEKGREQMFTYFQQWTELSPAQFTVRLNSLIEIEYNHLRTGESIREINNFINVIIKLFRQMSKLKFIGDQPDSGVVIGETVEPKKQEKKPGWSFLTD